MVVRIRNFSDQDLPSLVKLVNEAYREAYEFFPYDQHRLSSRIQEGKLKILLAEAKGRVLGSTAYSDGHWGEEIEWLFVIEVPDREVVENVLAREIEKYVKRGTVFTAVDAGSRKIKEWEERGYGLNNGLYHMVAGLDEVKSLPSIPEGVALRSLRLHEEKEFVETVNAGFGWERVRVGDVQRWKIESPPFDEEWIQIAEVDGTMVSVVVAKPDTYYNRFFNGRRGYVGPAATLPEHRSKNLASALTVRAMNFLLEKGMESVALYTSEQNLSSMALLRKLSFRISHHWQFMRKNLSKLQ
jgi:ribosomal protein S18 acetylase RimI-like enzyme